MTQDQAQRDRQVEPNDDQEPTVIPVGPESAYPETDQPGDGPSEIGSNQQDPEDGPEQEPFGSINPDVSDQDASPGEAQFETPYRFTEETPDLSASRGRSPLPYIFVAVVALAAVGAIVYFSGVAGNSNPITGSADAPMAAAAPTDTQTQILHDRIAENRQALNSIIDTTNDLTNQNAQMSTELGNVAGSVQQVQLPRMAQNQAQLLDKISQMELQLQRLEEENITIKQSQSDVLLIEQQLQSFQSEVADTRQAINDQHTALEDTRQLAEQNYATLQELNATPPPTDPVIRLAICMDGQMAKPPTQPGTPKPDYTEHIATVFRGKLQTGEMTMEAIEIRLANCLAEETE